MTISSIYVQNNVQDYLSAKSWLGGSLNTIQLHGGAANWSDWLTSPGWEAQQFAGQNVNIMWSIPLIPYGANLATAATGAYNNNYLALAKQMVANSHNSDQIYVRVGWEFNGKDWNSSSAVGHADDYIGAYRAFVDTFRSVSNKFVFEWTPNVGPTDMNPETAYPGDKYVDVIGTDLYYNTQWDSKDPQQAFNWFVQEQYGLQWQQDFAATHGKQTAVAEWGINSDAPQFVELMAKWVSDHNMLYQNYWDSNAAFQGKLSADQYPNAAAAFERLFGTSQTGGGGQLGNSISNVYNGTSKADIMKGSNGGDVMVGADGNDTYYINHLADHINEYYNAGKGGSDTAIASVNYTLDANVENLTLSGTGGLVGTGNSSANIITGSTGDDTTYGLDGNDTIYAGDGNDRVYGGSGDDKLTGNAGNDTLDGGTGTDNMVGGDGNDVYHVDSTDDVILENYNLGLGGTDQVYTSVSYTLSANVENLTSAVGSALVLTGNVSNNIIIGGTGNDTISGGDGADTLRGGDGDDRLLGGTGNDVLFGGAGKDVFVFGPGSGKDVIQDFGVGDEINASLWYAAGKTPTVTTVNGDTYITFDAYDRIIVSGVDSSHIHGTSIGFVFQ